jgi:8-oxo-dGTP diphosphatase
MPIQRKYFNVRVYGIYIHNDNLLISDEFIKGKEITKFPGGGLEFGEGPAECIVREFREELQIDVVARDHFYTTDFFVPSAFNPNAQVISLYYNVASLTEVNIPTSHRKFDFRDKKEGAQSFRWLPLSKISENDFTFVIDKKVATLLKEKYRTMNEERGTK